MIDEKDRGLILYLPFEENYGNLTLDWSGYDNSAQIFGASWIDGKIGKALYFDGIDDYILVSNSPSLNVSSITLCAWTYPTDFGADRVIISKNYTSGNRSYEIRFLPNGRIRFVVFLEGDVIVVFDTPVSAQLNKWNFVAATYTSGQPLRIYLNETKYEGPVATRRIQSSDVPLTVGSRPGPYLFFKGKIDDVRIYNRALSEEEIKDIYLSTLHKFYPIRFAHLQTFPGCILNLNFEERTGTIVYDQSGFKNHGTIYGASWTYGKIGRGLYFDGIDDYIDLGVKEIFKLSSAFSILGWFRFDPGTIGGKGVLQKVVGTTDFDYMLYLSVAGYPSIYIKNVGGTVYNVGYAVDIRDGKWHHWAATFDGRYLKMYVDGILRGTTDTGGIRVRTSDTPLCIGRGWGVYVRMFADEIRIYNRALSEREIKTIYYMGLKSHQVNPIV